MFFTVNSLTARTSLVLAHRLDSTLYEKFNVQTKCLLQVVDPTRKFSIKMRLNWIEHAREIMLHKAKNTPASRGLGFFQLQICCRSCKTLRILWLVKAWKESVFKGVAIGAVAVALFVALGFPFPHYFYIVCTSYQQPIDFSCHCLQSCLSAPKFWLRQRHCAMSHCRRRSTRGQWQWKLEDRSGCIQQPWTMNDGL